MIFKLYLSFTLLILSAFSLAAQHSQTIRGTVVEKNTLQPLSGASVMMEVNGRMLNVFSDAGGHFVIESVPVGRYQLTVTMMGYVPYVAGHVLVYSGKENFMEIALEESLTELDEVVVTVATDKNLPLNRMAAVSARMLSSEEANRYAGSWGDPARMAANFAGVMAAEDTRNDIIIRGNSPAGLLWKLDGFDIPNPNHFGAMGGTGGPIGMLNNNQLANSDFYTGAFPAEFGNALSGVFDLRLRNGNNQKHEFLAAAGFNGFELGAEGPLSKTTGASYLINGRYSFLEALYKMGFNMAATGAAVPEYQDVTAKVNVPLKRGNLSFIALWGGSHIRMTSDMSDASQWQTGDTGDDIDETNRQYFTGMNFTLRAGQRTRIENRLSWQYFNVDILQKQLSYPDAVASKYFDATTAEGRVAWVSSVHHRFNGRNFLTGGVGIDVFNTDMHEVFYGNGAAETYRDGVYHSALLKANLQWQHRFSDALSLTSGAYAHYYGLNGDISAEPRIGLKWAFGKRSSFNLGAGLHSQMLPRQVYFYRRNGDLPNKNLKFEKSWHSVAGYDLKPADNLRLKVETYYQYLFDIPVIRETPEESILNFGDGYYNSWDDVFTSQGTGENYGIELTAEKFFARNYYFLITASLYDAKYTGYDGVKRHSKFAGNYAVTVLGGYEWKIFSNLLSLNLKIISMGNKRILPVSVGHVGASPVYDYSAAYRDKLPAYFRCDLNINMKQNFRKCTLEWFFEIDNLTNRKNIWMQVYNAGRQTYDNTYQTGFMPMGGAKMYF
ncbi:MAG: carboxypeptidase-like regulatory domain-containing protein [Bacteroidales bacterium]|nr:carboxypeptidase-like regulatory domain-containing protein [Bacteroidales bacterium]